MYGVTVWTGSNHMTLVIGGYPVKDELKAHGFWFKSVFEAEGRTYRNVWVTVDEDDSHRHPVQDVLDRLGVN